MNLVLNVIGFLIFIATGLLYLILILKLILFFFKKRDFPKKMLLASLSGTVVFFCIFVYTNYFFTFGNLKGEPFWFPVASPTGQYTANAFAKPYGGATGGVKIWVNVIHHEENDRVQTVYYSEAKGHFSMSWKGEEVLSISHGGQNYPDSDRSIELKIGKEIYHENGLACTSLIMEDEYEECYQNQ
ncbi:DUF5412 family protein [Ureibacillus sinduriensis]|uniref:Uncharacterized protein n=1 Tax=Ureibacillus sinduriensis BLB-1 = JCM 15800 TaxID=1384057 RepID=A0A0A3HP11_9BACL|nr:DUF5412 family protein [Ureibacillus sinduriensis]KGR74266.1 hypothetical protein CD33_20015 [Ureibacillus sinduriensis BLB-1 = JCM 15800]